MTFTTRTWRAWSCTVRLAVTDASALDAAAADLADLLDRVDGAASRFRADSELSRANARAGRPTPVSELLIDLVTAALHAAWETGGLLDPTVGRALTAIGYDRDIADVAADGPAVTGYRSSRSWSDVRTDQRIGMLSVPVGTALDLGATAKAYTADLAANQIAQRYGTGVLVELGGDLAVAGSDNWPIGVAESQDGPAQVVMLESGGMATSTTTLRRWRRGGAELHHIIDPRTGTAARGPWRTATVSAPTALAANTASTNAILLGYEAPEWLTEHGLSARLVDQDGVVCPVGAWPVEVAA